MVGLYECMNVVGMNKMEYSGEERNELITWNRIAHDGVVEDNNEMMTISTYVVRTG